MELEKFDVVVVGAGPAGISAALTAAKGGLKVLLVERGDHPGSKNVMGGVLYRHTTEAVVPEFWKEAPLERPVVEQRIWVLTDDSAIKIGYMNERFGQEPYNAFTVLRAKFDGWFAGKAKEAGALLINETTIEDLIFEDGAVKGVVPGREDGPIPADVVILADGVNSILARKAGLRTGDIRPEKVALGVKEVIFLPKEKIEDRFNLENGRGATIELAGSLTKGMDGIGFLYTNKDSISIGIGALISDFAATGIRPYDLLDEMKKHPAVRPLIQGGEAKEYSAHLLPEGGYRELPRLYGNGVMLVGDAAGLFNALHREGSNLATTSGVLAAQTAIEAKRRGDFSAATLSLYEKKMQESNVLQDLRKYEGWPSLLANHRQLLTLYPDLASDAAYSLLSVNGTTKGQVQRQILKDLWRQLPVWDTIKTAYHAWRAI